MPMTKTLIRLPLLARPAESLTACATMPGESVASTEAAPRAAAPAAAPASERLHALFARSDAA